MNHLEAAFTGKNQLWRYIVMVVAIFLVINSIGSIPLVIAMASKSFSDPGSIDRLAEDPSNLGVLGLEPNIGLFAMLFPFATGLLAYILLVKPLHRRTFLSTINGTSKFRWNRFLVSASVWLSLQVIFLFVSMKADPENFTVNNVGSTIIPLIIISVLLIPFQATFEEVLFRGYFMQGFTNIYRYRWFPLLVTGLLFALLHSYNPEVKEYGFFTMMPQYLLFGLLFGLITVLDDGIEASMGAHSANNTFISIMVTQESATLQTQAVFRQHEVSPWSDFTGLLVIGIILVIVLGIIFKWRNFPVIFGKVQEKVPVSDTVN